MIQGSMVALVTPMTADNQLDWDSLQNLVEWHIEKGTDAIVAVGTTGESATLEVSEHLEVIRRVVDQINGRKEAGADACLSVTPYYNKPTQEGLFLHHQAIAKAVALPQLLYNVPGRTGVDMLPETVQRLSKVENIIGVKEATGDLDRARWLIANTEGGFLILSGDDITAVELMLLGGKGNISVTANVAPAEIAQMCELAIAGRADEARAINTRLNPVHAAMFVESNPIPVKWAVAEMGLMKTGIRLPLTPLSEQYHSQVRSALQGAGLL